MKINIVGGGIIGLFAAYYLQEEGHEIHIFDKGDLSDGCSYGNAGMITPSHFVPLAAPGVVAQGVRWMFSVTSPFYIKPRMDLELVQWLWRFYRSCNKKQAEAAMPVLLDFNLAGKKLYREFYQKTGVDFKLEERGILMLYKTTKKEKEELAVAEKAVTLGIETKYLDRTAVREFENGTTVDALGGVFWPCDAHLYPNILMGHLISLLKKNGARFYGDKSVANFEKKGNKITAIICDGEKFEADATIVATGSWSGILLKKLGIKLLIQDGKGYSITLPNPTERPNYATIFSEAKVAVTPMGDDLRFGGTLELGGLNTGVNKKRIQGLLNSIPRYYPNLKVEMPSEKNIWRGFRPCSPDGLPYIGKLNNYDNLFLATGHAMMGLSLAPATGVMVKNIICENKVDKNYSEFFDANRYN
ncbi:MAG: FAD-dependent oxidoreductase [Bacteroidota bacterium]